MDRAADSTSGGKGGAGDLATPEAVPLSRYVVFFSIALLGCALDLLTKAWVFGWHGAHVAATGDLVRNLDTYWIIEGFFGIQTSLNRGALFGMGQGQVAIFAVMSVIAAGGIIYWLFVRKAALELWLTIALGMVMAGIFGNLYDRLGLWAPTGESVGIHCAVRDWIRFDFFGWTWPNFNIADSFLVCGAILIVIDGLRHEDLKTEPANG